MTEVFIVGAARTPIGRFMGGLSQTPAPRLGAVAVRAAVERAGIDPEIVDDVVMGNVVSAGLGQAPARQAALGAGIPDHSSATTVNKVCASGLEALNIAAQTIRLGGAAVMVAGGMENMSAAPHLFMGSRRGVRLGGVQLEDAVVHDGLWCPFEDRHMGHAAEAIAEKYGISRREMDEYSLRSHEQAVSASEAGRFDDEIVPVVVANGKGSTVVARDEGPRADTSTAALGALKPAFTPDGLVTAGNAPGITDGAAALVIACEQAVQTHKLRPLARVVAHATFGIAPLWLFDAPVGAIQRLLEKTGTRLEDYDLFEINEAFAAQVLANGKVLGWDWDRVNVQGGAIALGHPIGATGARLVVTLLHALAQRGGKRGMAALCHGGGGGVAMSFELLS
ncbi:MAG: thiolase family protein [Chloroflexi bacterium]|nr:thiolase family protein [Chloroflexota bacterium]